MDAGGVHVLPGIAAALRSYAEAGLSSAGFSEALGGSAVSFVACAASFAYFAAANLAASAYPMLTGANARLIARFGSEAQIDAFARHQIEGRWFGTMCLSEPQAGSSLSDIRVSATFQGADALGERYLISGNKMWISGGDQDASENIVHLVLAKVPLPDGQLPEGTKGISLFIVPKRLPDGSRNDILVAGLNHKMGYRGTANCLLNFGEAAGAIGWLVGQESDGLRQMFQMMNEARINVGIGAAAVAYRGYLLSLAYAQERLQGRQTGVRSGHPVPIIEHPDVRRMLLQQKCYVEGALALCLYGAWLVDREDDPTCRALLGLLTPVIKTWPSEFGLAANDLAIQIHGGYGYTRDFDVEQLYRDNRLNPIHEGTTGIQALDLLTRKLLGGEGGTLQILLGRIGDTCARASTGLAEEAAALREVWMELETTLSWLVEAPDDFVACNATPLLRAFGHAVVAWLWLDQALAAEANAALGASFVEGKRKACRFFYEAELPFVRAWLAPLARRRSTPASMAVENF
jgi:alkylation response protein AidB-like acyl-CoA dehydrogenase